MFIINNLIIDILRDFSNIDKIIKNISNKINYTDIIGTGTTSIITKSFFNGNIVAIKLYKDFFGIPSRKILDSHNVVSKYIRNELRVLLANNVLDSFNICHTCNKCFGIVQNNTLTFDDLFYHSYNLQNRNDEVSFKYSLILEYIEGQNLSSLNKFEIIDLLKNNENIIFEIVYSMLCCGICLNYIQVDLHKDNIMFNKHNDEKVIYNIFGNNLIFTKKITPHIVDFGSVKFESTIYFKEIELSCSALLGIEIESLRNICPQLFNDGNNKKLIYDILLNLHLYFNDHLIENNSESHYCSIDEQKIINLSAYKNYLISKNNSVYRRLMHNL